MKRNLWLMAPVRRTDWLPVGEDTGGGEQLRRSALSESDDSEGEWETDSDIESSDEDRGSSDEDLSTSVRWLLSGAPDGLSKESDGLFE